MYIGIDVDKNFLTIKEVDEEGEEINNEKLRNSLEALAKFAGKHEKHCKIALEASSYSRPVYRYLVKEGFEVHMAHPGALDKITKSNNKTDEHDALDLAQLLRTGYLPESWVPDEELESLRSLIWKRVELGKRTAQVKNRIHGLLAINGIREPNVTDLFGQHGIHFMERLELPNESQQVLRSLLRELAYLKEEVGLLESRLAKIGKGGRFKKGVKRIMEIRGVGYYSALAQLAWIGPVDRFSDDRKISSWVGIVPRVRQSGNKEFHGHITKAGPSLLRWVLISDATVAVKYPGKLRRYYLRLKRRVGHKKAIVATAHKLLRIIYHMLKEDKPYEERDDDLLYRKLKKMELKAKELKSERLEKLERKGREILINEEVIAEVE
jgi:transposase